MPDLSSPFVWTAAVAAALCVGMAKTGFAGLGIVSVSLFAQLFPARESTGALLPLIPDRQFTRLLGCLILALMALTVWQRRYPGMPGRAAEHPLLGVSAGVAIGIATMLANAAGAITAFYFLARRMDKMTFVGTAAWFYLIVNLSKVPFSIQLNLINPASLSFDLMLLPVVALGCAGGRLLLRSVPQQLFEWITIATASAAALRLILAA